MKEIEDRLRAELPELADRLAPTGAAVSTDGSVNREVPSARVLNVVNPVTRRQWAMSIAAVATLIAALVAGVVMSSDDAPADLATDSPPPNDAGTSMPTSLPPTSAATLQTVVAPEFGIELDIPLAWTESAGGQGSREWQGEDGWVKVLAASAQEGLPGVVDNMVNHHLRPFGSAPTITEIVVDGADSRLILPSSDAPALRGFPEAMIAIGLAPDMTITAGDFGVLTVYADTDHVEAIADSIRFLDSPTVTEPAPSEPASRLEEAARSASFGLSPLWDLAADEDGVVWAAIGCGRTLRFDQEMSATLELTDRDLTNCTLELVEVDAQGQLYATDSVAAPNADSREADGVPVLTRVSLSGDEEILRSFVDDPLSGVFEVSGTNAITVFGSHVAVVDLETATLVAEAELDGGVVAMALTDASVWVSTTNNAVIALERDTLRTVSRRDFSEVVQQLVAVDDRVWGLVDGEVVAVSDDGLAVPETTGRFLGQRASDGRLWLVTREALLVFAADTGVEIARFEFEAGHIPGVLEVSGRNAWLEDGMTHEVVRYELID